MRRSSTFHSSLNRPQLYAGVPTMEFLLIMLGGSFCFVAKIYQAIPAMLLLWVIARWLTKKDTAWAEILQQYLRETHVYDSLPRPVTFLNRPRGWGKGLPW